MSLNFYQKTSIPTTVSYVIPKFSVASLEDAKSKGDLNKYILSQTQGDPVMLSEDMDISSLMYIANIIYDSSPELVFVTKDALKIQVFDFTSEPVIRPTDINTSFVFLHRDMSFDKSTDVLQINIQNLWDLQTDIANITPEQRLYNVLQDILKQITLNNKTVLIGNGPAILFLLTQHYLSGKTKELWYQENINSKPVRIY